MTQTQDLQSVINASFERTRPYVAVVAQRLMLTYLLPMSAAVLISTVGSRLLLNLLPELPLSTATLALLAINIMILVKGWQWLEKRYQGTKLFFLYNVVSRNRRDLKRLMAQSSTDATANTVIRQLGEAENDFIAAAGTAQTVQQ